MRRYSIKNLLIIFSLALIALLLIILIGVLALVGASESMDSWFSSASSCIGSSPYSSQRVETVAQVTFPDTISNFRAESLALQDCIIYVSFHINASEFQEFLASTDISVNLTERPPTDSFLDAPSTLGWNLEHERNYLFGEGSNNRGHQYLLVDSRLPSIYLIYFIVTLS
jgi:hypothetical protein